MPRPTYIDSRCTHGYLTLSSTGAYCEECSRPPQRPGGSGFTELVPDTKSVPVNFQNLDRDPGELTVVADSLLQLADGPLAELLAEYVLSEYEVGATYLLVAEAIRRLRGEGRP